MANNRSDTIPPQPGFTISQTNPAPPPQHPHTHTHLTLQRIHRRPCVNYCQYAIFFNGKALSATWLTPKVDKNTPQAVHNCLSIYLFSSEDPPCQMTRNPGNIQMLWGKTNKPCSSHRILATQVIYVDQQPLAFICNQVLHKLRVGSFTFL